jgi:ComF family protein
MLTQWTGIFFDALFPAKCLICGSFLKNDSIDQNTGKIRVSSEFILFEPLDALFRNLMSRLLCHGCVSGFSAIESPLCPVCGIMFGGEKGADHLCPKCIELKGYFQKARAAGVYGGALSDLVHRFKYQGKIQLAVPLGFLLFVTFVRNWMEEDPVDLILPVPLFKRRFRKRGFNQAYLLIKDWPYFSKLYGLPRFPYEIRKEVLKKRVQTRPQTLISWEERQTNLRNVFAVQKPPAVLNRRILIVDDVMTTGATAEECARTLLDSGAGRVDILTLARAM